MKIIANQTRKAHENIIRLLRGPQSLACLKHLEGIQGMRGANRLLKRIASAPDKEQLRDYLAEVWYALIFAGLAFDVEIEPYGHAGPDLKISRDGRDAAVEIMRFRKMFPGPPELDLSDENTDLPTYGDPIRDVRKASQKISEKFRQVRRKSSIVAIWNDEEEMDERRVKRAVAEICGDMDRGIRSVPSGVLFVVYGSPWVATMGNSKQLHCFAFRSLREPYQIEWQRELQSSLVNELLVRAPCRATGPA